MAVKRPQKSVLRAYAWLLPLGLFGAHRFYLKKPGKGLAFAFGTVAGSAAALYGYAQDHSDILYLGMFIGFFVIAAMLVDFIALPGMVEEFNNPGEDRRLAAIAGNLDPSFQATMRHVGRDEPDQPRKSKLGDDYVRPWHKDRQDDGNYRPGDD